MSETANSNPLDSRRLPFGIILAGIIVLSTFAFPSGATTSPIQNNCTWTIYSVNNGWNGLQGNNTVPTFTNPNFTVTWDNVLNSVVPGKGGSICMGAGTATTSSNLSGSQIPITVFNNLTVIGASEGASVLKLVTPNPANTFKSLFFLNGLTNNLTFTNLVFNGNGFANDLLDFGAASYGVSYQNDQFVNCGSVCMILTGRNTLVSDSVFSQGTDAIAIQSTGSIDLRVQRNSFVGFTHDCIFFQGGFNQGIVIDNNFRECGSTAASGESIRAVSLTGAHHLTITGNTFYNKFSTASIINIIIGDNIAIVGNTMFTDSATGNATQMINLNSGTSTVTVSGNIIKMGAVTSTSAAGLNIQGGSGYTVTANVFTIGGTNARCIILNGINGGEVSDNYCVVAGAGVEFVTTASQKFVLDDNTFSAATNSILWTAKPTTKTEIVKNNLNYNPVGSPGAGCVDASNFFAPWGTTGACTFTLISGTTYTDVATDALLMFVNTGSAAGNIVLTGNGLVTSTTTCGTGLPTIDLISFPIGSTIVSTCTVTQPQINIAFQ